MKKMIVMGMVVGMAGLMAGCAKEKPVVYETTHVTATAPCAVKHHYKRCYHKCKCHHKTCYSRRVHHVDAAGNTVVHHVDAAGNTVVHTN